MAIHYDKEAFEALKAGRDAWNNYRTGWVESRERVNTVIKKGTFCSSSNLTTAFFDSSPIRKNISLLGAPLTGLDLSKYIFSSDPLGKVEVDMRNVEISGTNFTGATFVNLPMGAVFDSENPPKMGGVRIIDCRLLLAMANESFAPEGLMRVWIADNPDSKQARQLFEKIGAPQQKVSQILLP